MVSYLDFMLVTINGHVREKFLDEMHGLNLGQIIRENKHGLRIVFHEAVGLKDVYLVMIVANNDQTLVQLANKYHFPRGFPIIWIPGKMVHYFGFYPKFTNDERQTADNLSEFNGVNSITFFKKWSGFLAQVIIFKIDDQTCWSVTSKNSANKNSNFIIDAKQMFRALLKDNMIEMMADRQLHLCAEIISSNDQTHGSRVLLDVPIITAIGIGHRYDPTKGQMEKKDNMFVTFYQNLDVVNFCCENNLPCDSAIYITGSSCEKFIRELVADRDFMDDDKLEQLLSNPTFNITIYNGTIQHKNVLGNCLEGLVLNLTYTNGQTTTKKYKFPKYTIRTMLLREIFKNFVFGYGLVDKTNEFIQNWCISEKGKEFWYDFALECFMEYPSFYTDDKLVGIHIQIAEHVTNKIFDDTREKFKKVLDAMPACTVIICIGPIASGKTSFATEFANQNPIFKPIDGDVLDIGNDLTKKLGKERNDYTIWNVKKAIMAGNVPILSTGGGALFSPGKELYFILKKQLQSTFGMGCKMILCIAGHFDNITMLGKDYDPNPFYQQLETIKEATKQRVINGEWLIDPKFRTTKVSEENMLENFCTFIAKKSSDNVKFVKCLVGEADHIFGFPTITRENYGVQKNFDFPKIISLVGNPVPISSGKFSQIRLLVQVDGNTINHITWMYDGSGQIIFGLDDFRDLTLRYPKEINGIFYELPSIDGKLLYSFVLPEKAIHNDGTTHITINSNQHPAKETKKIVLAMKTGNSNLLIPMHNGKMVEYNLNKIQSRPCSIRILSAFGI